MAKDEYIIVDTDILIDAGREVGEAIAYLREIENRSAPKISAVTRMELIVGCRNKNELQVLERFLTRFHTMPLNEQISDLAVDLLSRYRLSHGLLIPDALITATAMSANEQFATKNQRHYRFIEGLLLTSYPR
ncbi:MAG: type II toxin-antitoxin system VapC family toxin [Rubrobacter sp.]|nr:type II toxin-antitoxin system VapC family toxin [Rubrobacter sp.]